MNDKSEYNGEESGEEALGRSEQFKQDARIEYKKWDLMKMVREMAEQQGRKLSAEDKLKEINARLDVLRLELIPAEMENRGLESFKLEGVGRVSLTADLYARITAGKTDEFFQWLKDQKLGSLIKAAINPSTLKAFVKGRIKDGKEIPEGMVSVTPFQRASITKS